MEDISKACWSKEVLFSSFVIGSRGENIFAMGVGLLESSKIGFGRELVGVLPPLMGLSIISPISHAHAFK